MKKQILVSLLIVSSTSAPAMENTITSFFSPLSSYFSAWPSNNQTVNESKLVSDRRTSKNNFENQLIDKWLKLQLQYGMLLSPWLTSATATKFLPYCYYHKFHEINIATSLSKLNAPLLKKCQEAHIDGYSALGAAMIAKEVSIKEKLNFIQQLINRDFKPTPKDRELAELALYDKIAKRQKAILHACSAYWFVLPQEIRKQILWYMVQLFKKDSWLLPEKKPTETLDQLLNRCCDVTPGHLYQFISIPKL